MSKSHFLIWKKLRAIICFKIRFVVPSFFEIDIMGTQIAMVFPQFHLFWFVIGLQLSSVVTFFVFFLWNWELENIGSFVKRFVLYSTCWLPGCARLMPLGWLQLLPIFAAAAAYDWIITDFGMNNVEGVTFFNVCLAIHPTQREILLLIFLEFIYFNMLGKNLRLIWEGIYLEQVLITLEFDTGFMISENNDEPG